MNEEEKKAIKRCKQIIKDNNEIIKEARKNRDINSMQLTASLDNDSLAIETVLNLLEKKDNKIALLEQVYKELQNDFDNLKKDKDINYLDGIHHKKLVEKSIGQIIDKPEECWFDQVEVKIIVDNTIFTNVTSDDFITLKEIANIFHNKNCITVIAESPLSGTIYRYNNYGDKKWQLIGTMLGYA